MVSVATRPKLCPCARTCKPIWNTLVVDPRIKDEEADMNQGYSGECIGQMIEPIEFTYGGAPHKNDVNHCHFTPLKGIIRFQECFDDLWSSWLLISRAMDVLKPLVCTECGQSSRHSSHFWLLVPPELRSVDMTPEEFNKSPRKTYCDMCTIRLGLLEWHAEEKKYW